MDEAVHRHDIVEPAELWIEHVPNPPVDVGGEGFRFGAYARQIDQGWRNVDGDNFRPALGKFDRERAVRLDALAALQAGSRESRIIAVEQALIANDLAVGRVAAAALDGEPTTRRLAALRARLALAFGLGDEARAWIARGAEAPLEPDWSDIDADGRAFPYSAADWARVVSAYAETGELIHPRLERREPTFGDLPRAPAGYVDSAPFLTHPFIAALESGEPLPPIVDDSDFGDALQAMGS